MQPASGRQIEQEDEPPLAAASGAADAEPADPIALSAVWSLFGIRHVPYRILILSRMLERVTGQQLRDEFGISLAQWRLMAHLARLGRCSASDISAVAYVDRAEVSRTVASLEVRGLLVRLLNPRNRRSRLLELSAQGRELHDRVLRHRRTFFDEMTSEIAPDELAMLGDLLLRLALRLQPMVK